MKALKIIGIILAVLVVIVLALGMMGAKELHVERSIVIDAPQELVLSQVKSLKSANEWSPWKDLDSNMTVTFEGTDGEVGSISRWESDKAGKGSQEVTSITADRVDIKLTFLKPFESVNAAFFQLAPEGDGVKTTWGFDGKMNFIMKVMSHFQNMDAAIGKDYEKGLARLKARCEQLANEKKTYRGYEIQEVQWGPKTYFGKKDKVPFPLIGKFYGENLPAIAAALGKAGMNISGSPVGIYYSWDDSAKVAEMAAAMPVTVQGNETTLKGYERIDLAESKALHIVYYGAYEGSEEAHYAMDDYMKEKGLKIGQTVLEEYVNDPMSEPDTSKWLTNIYYLVE